MKKRYMVLSAVIASLSFSSLLIAATTGNKISMEEAKAIALSKVQGGVVSGIELEQKLGKSIYEVEVHLDGYEYDLKIDAATGAGISVKKELSNDSRSIEISDTAMQDIITEEEAIAIAMKQVPGAAVTEVELDYDKGSGVYELELTQDIYEYDVKIDAVSGSILKCEVDD